MVSAEATNGWSEQHQQTAVEMAVRESGAFASTATNGLPNEITPPSTQSIFSISYPRGKPSEQVTKLTEAEISVFSQFTLWA
ncbi:hypothetical protein Nepgr_000549 [Nepenthes gracilis]|uniref:Uncharacterized protein n=1 Tax=Nepenthes gracilis TaxID=150966 RepID=A0AAD3P1W6_NEPGR|nr:hypothetical protein Nepgr_000549 [Nepenthes gracilis]